MTRKRLLYLHIGSHKTGTTSIQKALYNAKLALNDHDFYLFSRGPDGKENQTGSINNWIQPRSNSYTELIDGRGLFLSDLKSLVCYLLGINFNNIILSAEGLSWIFNEAYIEKIMRNLTQFFHVKIIIYIRRSPYAQPLAS